MKMAGCVLGKMCHVSDEFDNYVKTELKKRGLPIQGKHAGLFIILYNNNNKLEFKEIAEKWKKSKSTLCDIVSRYEEMGYIERVGCCLDKRNVYVKFTKEGIEVGEILEEMAVEFLVKTTRGLSEEQKKIMEEVLQMMVKNL